MPAKILQSTIKIPNITTPAAVFSLVWQAHTNAANQPATATPAPSDILFCSLSRHVSQKGPDRDSDAHEDQAVGYRRTIAAGKSIPAANRDQENSQRVTHHCAIRPQATRRSKPKQATPSSQCTVGGGISKSKSSSSIRRCNIEVSISYSASPRQGLKFRRFRR